MAVSVRRRERSLRLKAVICRAFAPYAQLRVEVIPVAVPGPGEALIEVRAAGVNCMDALMVEGK